MEKARKLDIREEIYYDIIRKKTASLIAAACSAGAASVSSDEDLIERMRTFGELIGIAFQIRMICWIMVMPISGTHRY